MCVCVCACVRVRVDRCSLTSLFKSFWSAPEDHTKAKSLLTISHPALFFFFFFFWVTLREEEKGAKCTFRFSSSLLLLLFLAMCSSSSNFLRSCCFSIRQLHEMQQALDFILFFITFNLVNNLSGLVFVWWADWTPLCLWGFSVNKDRMMMTCLCDCLRNDCRPPLPGEFNAKSQAESWTFWLYPHGRPASTDVRL